MKAVARPLQLPEVRFVRRHRGHAAREQAEQMREDTLLVRRVAMHEVLRAFASATSSPFAQTDERLNSGYRAERLLRHPPRLPGAGNAARAREPAATTQTAVAAAPSAGPAVLIDTFFQDVNQVSAQLGRPGTLGRFTFEFTLHPRL